MKVTSAFCALWTLMLLSGHVFARGDKHALGFVGSVGEDSAPNRQCLPSTVSKGFAVDTDGGVNADGSLTYQAQQSYMGNWGGNINPSRVLGGVNLDGRNGLHGGDIICYENLVNGKNICAVVFDNGYARSGQSVLGKKPAEATAPVHYALGASNASGSGSTLGSATIKSYPIKLGNDSRGEINNLLKQARITNNYHFVNKRIQEIAQQHCPSLNPEPLPADQYQSQIRENAFSFDSPRKNYLSPMPATQSRALSPFDPPVDRSNKPLTRRPTAEFGTFPVAKANESLFEDLNDQKTNLDARRAELVAKIADLEKTNMPEDRAEIQRLRFELSQLNLEFKELQEQLKEDPKKDEAEKSVSEADKESNKKSKLKSELRDLEALEAAANKVSNDADSIARRKRIEEIKNELKKIMFTLPQKPAPIANI